VAEEFFPDELLDLLVHRVIDPPSLYLNRFRSHDYKGLWISGFDSAPLHIPPFEEPPNHAGEAPDGEEQREEEDYHDPRQDKVIGAS